LFNPNPYDPWQGTVTPNTADTAWFTTRDYAPYAFDTITLSPHWKLNAGLRWDRYNTRARDPGDPADFSGSDQQSFMSYQAALMYKPAEQGTVYLMASSASIPVAQADSGAGQDQSFPSVPGSYPGTIGLKPEKTRSVEFGTKWNLFANRLLLSGDIFAEQHIDTEVAVTPDLFEQIGRTSVKGVELSANGSITEDWNMIAGYSFLDAMVKDGNYYDEVGDQLPNTPRNSFSLWSTYRVIPSVVLGGGANYRSKLIGYAGPPDDHVGAYWRFDAMGKWQVDRHVALQLNVQNLLNRQYFSKDFYWYALPAPGRTFMGTVDVRF
jgi:catecholate siderophore receptor